MLEFKVGDRVAIHSARKQHLALIMHRSANFKKIPDWSGVITRITDPDAEYPGILIYNKADSKIWGHMQDNLELISRKAIPRVWT